MWILELLARRSQGGKGKLLWEQRDINSYRRTRRKICSFRVAVLRIYQLGDDFEALLLKRCITVAGKLW